MIHTSCKNCIFAQYEWITQTGCSLGRLDKFRELDIPILECYDEQLEFFVVNGRQCMYNRNERWGNYFPQEQWASRIEEELALKYNVIVLANSGSLEDIERTCDSCHSQSSKPQHYTVVFGNNLKAPKIGRILDKYGVKWRLQKMEEGTTDGQAIDLVADIIKFPYYVVLDNGQELKEGSIELLQSKIVDEMFVFGLIKNWNGSRQIVPYSLHKQFNGNAFLNYEDKLIQENHQDKIYDKEI